MPACLKVILLQNAIAAIAAINSAPRALEVASGDFDETNLLQEKMTVASNHSQEPELRMDEIELIPPQLFDHVTAEMSPLGSYLSDDNLHCIQGPHEQTELKHSMSRASPLSVLHSLHEFLGGLTCADRGYTDMTAEEDECMSHASRWARPGSPTERLRVGGPTGGLWTAAFDQYDVTHGYASGTSRSWVGCGICSADSQIRREGIWGELDCDNYPQNVLNGMRARPGGMASIVPAGDEVCFEGSREYLESSVQRSLTTPLGVVFAGQEIQDVDCTARGFDSARDIIDECWSQSAKHIRSQNEGNYMINWIATYHTAIREYDSSSLSDGRWSNMDWVSCGACDLGGAVRDRGMWQSQHGGDSIPYTDAYCNAMHFPTESLFESH